MLPPKERNITPPVGGWKPRTYYAVEVALHSGNPIHRAIFYCGFLTPSGEPGAYSQIWNGSYDEAHSYSSRLHYMAVLKEILADGNQS